jgi:tripeptide aminopeptidase
MSLGISALTIRLLAPKKSGRAHSLDEWIDVEKEPIVKAIATTLSVILAVTGLQ